LLPCAEPDTAGDNDEDEDDDDKSSGSSVNDVPTDRELDRMIAAQEAHRARQQQLAGQQEQQQAPKPGGPGAADGPLQMQRQGEQQQTQVLPAKHGGRRGKTVSWAQDQLPVPATAAAEGVPPALGGVPDRGGSPANGPPDLSLPPPLLHQQQGAEDQAPPAGAAVPGSVQHAASLPLTQGNVALLDSQLEVLEEGRASPTANQARLLAAVAGLGTAN
jgi:hypothetical protein